jgi:hypothetical protein
MFETSKRLAEIAALQEIREKELSSGLTVLEVRKG